MAQPPANTYRLTIKACGRVIVREFVFAQLDEVGLQLRKIRPYLEQVKASVRLDYDNVTHIIRR